jgi:hypothetical protein
VSVRANGCVCSMATWRSRPWGEKLSPARFPRDAAVERLLDEVQRKEKGAKGSVLTSLVGARACGPQ